MDDVTIRTGSGAADQSRGWSIKNTLNSLLTDSARAWNTSSAKVIVLWTLPVIFCLMGVVAALMGKNAYKAFTTEDGIAENIQVLMFVIAFVYCLRVVHKKANQREYLFAALYGILCVGLFFVIGEELSWGQRLIGWDTPENMRMANKQDETNIHNLHGVGDTIKWLHLVFAAYGVFMPLIVARMKGLQRYSKQISMVVPHYSLIPFFLIPLLWRLFRNLVEVPKRFYFVVSEYTEVIELVIAGAILFFVIYQYQQVSRKDRHTQRARNSKSKMFIQ
jgi:hypothetical protein